MTTTHSPRRPSARVLTVLLTLCALLVAGTGMSLAVQQPPVPAPTAATGARAGTVPDAPHLTARQRGSDRVRLTWSAPAASGPRVTGYRVARIGEDVLGAERSVVVLGPRRRGATLTSLRDGSTYTFAVAALSRGGRGPAARVRLSTTSIVGAARAITPGAPTIVSASASDQRMTVTWNPPAQRGTSPVTGYLVARDGVDAEGKGAWSTLVPATTRSFEMTLLNNGTTYKFSVAAVTAVGQGPSASVWLTPTAPVARPGAPTIASTAAGDQVAAMTWTPPAQTGTSPVTGYRVGRDGVDAEGKGAWSTLVPATTRSFEMTLLNNGTAYTLTVAAVNASGAGPAASVKVTPVATPPTTPPTTTTGNRPVVVQSAIGQPATLRRGGPGGERLRLAGVSVWGVPDTVTAGGNFGLNQYNNRTQIVAAARAWGANHIRLRVLADDYNNDRQGLSKAQRLAMIKGWRDAATAAGLYLYVTWWDSLDGYAEDANWPTRYRSAFAMMTDVHRTLGNDEHVFYEPFNEPNSFGDQWNAWGSAMRDTVAHWRSIGYTGVLVIDTPVWSHAYDDQAMTALERYDAALPGMGGKHQLIYAKHDYANEGWPDGGDTFDAAKWRNDTGGSQRHHLVFQSEYGNYNGDASSVHLSWSQQASTFFADEFANPGRPNYVGATAFVWGPWWDGNALTDASNSTPTAWGRAVRDNFLRRAAPTRW